MSAAEIADNRWELSSTKAPVATFSGLAQLILMGSFTIFFGWIVTGSVIAIVTPKEDTGWAGQFKNLDAEGTQEPAAE